MSDRPARRPDPAPRLDEVDERILWTLAADARIPNNRLAAAVGIAPSTCLTRVRALEDAGLVRGYRADIDVARLGFAIEAMVSVRVHAAARHELREFAKRLLRVPVVQDVSFLAGDKDFLVHIACTSTEQLRTSSPTSSAVTRRSRRRRRTSCSSGSSLTGRSRDGRSTSSAAGVPDAHGVRRQCG
ncbi:Lrp/AsnC family transcriptional regulator [Curtobacterium flaccumfaciens]|nr:Lrp/AsnC family transcriptional regulator [Curtobacterium flaccumfaciens]